MFGYSRTVCLLICLWAIEQAPEAFASADSARRPNILLIMCDDMGWSDVGCYGGEVETPHIDQLAAQGMRFTQFYNNAKCTTTRASILTGLYPRPEGELLQTNMITLGEALRRSGYQTALCGKWHLGRDKTTHPFRRGFDEFYGLLDGCCNYFDPSIRDPAYKGNNLRYFGHNDQQITEFPGDFYTTDAFTDHAVKTIRQFHKTQQPFLLHLCYTAPHYPLHAKPEDIAKYRGKFLHGWDEMRRRRFQRQQKLGLIDSHWKLSGSDSRAYAWESADHEFEDLRMAVYAAMIDRMDQNIGRLTSLLAELDIADDTVVMFLSDNGGCSEEPGGRNPAQRRPGPKDDYVAVGPSWGWAQNAPFRRYKSWTHEGGVRTPLIVRWPGQAKPGSITRQPGHIIDMLPTCLELAGGNYPSEAAGQSILPVEGKSLVPVFRGRDRDPHKQLYWEWAGSAAIRENNWKLVWDTLVKKWELYDLESDPTETDDLAPQHTTLVARLAADYDAWAERTGNRRIAAPHSADAAKDNHLTSKELADGWQLLFNGRDVAGWRCNNGKPIATPVEDGCLVPYQSGGYLIIHEAQFGDFVLKCDVRWEDEECNSGVFFRVEDPLNPVHTGFEVQVMGGRETGKHAMGALYDLAGVLGNASNATGEWNSLEIRCKGPHIRVKVNRQLVSEINCDEFDQPGVCPDGLAHKYELDGEPRAIKDFARTGLLGFQDHGHKVWYKNVKLRRLKGESVPN